MAFTRRVTSRHLPVVIVVSDDPRVGPALISYLASDNSDMTMRGPVGYHELNPATVSDADIVVCDLDGTELTAALHWVETLVSAPAIAVVALSSNPTVRRRALEHGAASAVDKSADVDRIARLVTSAAQKGHTTRRP
jgi:DNA-binding NarL/FixJ family response regulator